MAAAAVLVLLGGVSLFRSLPAGDVDPFGALSGALGALIGGASQVIPVRQYLRDQRAGAEEALARTVLTHEDRQFDDLLAPSRELIELDFQFSPTPGDPRTEVSGKWDMAADLFLQLPGPVRRLAIIGEPGSGKSLLANDLTRKLTSRHAQGACGVPVLLSLSSWTFFPTDSPSSSGFHREFRGWLVNQVSRTYGQPSAQVEKALGNLVLVLDGLDEMDPDPVDAGDRAAPRPRARALLRYLAENRECPREVVVTCRKAAYDEFGGWSPLAGAARVTLQTVPSATAKNYLERLSRWANADFTTRWDDVITDARAAPSGPLAQALSTPWRLNTLVKAYHVRTEDGSEWERDPSELVERWGSRALLARYRQTVIDQVDTVDEEEWTRWSEREQLRHAQGSVIARDMADQLEEYLLSLYVRSVIAQHPEKRYRYPAERVSRWLALLASHRTVDDFGASYRQDLARLARRRANLAPHQLWPLGGRRLVRTVHGSLTTLFALCLTGLTVAAVVATDEWSEAAFCLPLLSVALTTAHHSWSNRYDIDSTARALRYGRSMGIPRRYVMTFTGTLLGVAFGGVFGFAVAVDLTHARPHAIPPSVWVATTAGALIGVQLVKSVSTETPTTIKGAVPGQRHLVFLACAALRGRLPLRLGRFLAWAHEGGLLRVTGPSYQFRHDAFEQFLWRSYWREHAVAGYLAAAETVCRTGEAITEGRAEARQMLTEISLLSDREPDVRATGSAGANAAAGRATAALRTWATHLSAGTTERALNSYEERALHAVARFRDAAAPGPPT